MKAIDVFRKHKSEIVRLWTDAVFDTYPLETTGFLRTKEDPFGNPVANMTKEAAGALYDAVTGEAVEVDATRKALDRFIKLRAVQKFLPSQSMHAGACFALHGHGVFQCGLNQDGAHRRIHGRPHPSQQAEA